MDQPDVLLRLELINKNNEIALMRTEIDNLKHDIYTMIKDGWAAKRTMTDATCTKWKYYHANKNAVAKDMAKDLNTTPDKISWHSIKKITDAAAAHESTTIDTPEIPSQGRTPRHGLECLSK